jgi:spore germination cell wall hydrolase CwlJ-like protein
MLLRDMAARRRSSRFRTPFRLTRRPLTYWRAMGWWQSLRFRWQTWDKSHVLFAFALIVPLAAVAGMARFAFVDHMESQAARQRHTDLTCLAENIYYEARGEPLAGQYAVAEVTLNRVAAPQFPKTICAVVHQKSWDRIRRRYVGAFSWTELEDRRRPRGRSWQRALTVATAVYDKEVTPGVDGALFYHASYVEPSWAETKQQVAQIGTHIFYR